MSKTTRRIPTSDRAARRAAVGRVGHSYTPHDAYGEYLDRTYGADWWASKTPAARAAYAAQAARVSA